MGLYAALCCSLLALCMSTPFYTPLGGSWLNMSESIQRILVRRALDGEPLTSPQQIIEWLEEIAEGRNADPTPFGDFRE
jgi:hypothetical protein